MSDGVLGAYYADPFTMWFCRSIPRTTWPLLYISAFRLRAMMRREVCDDKSIARLSLHAADGSDPREFCLKRQHLMSVRIRASKRSPRSSPKHATIPSTWKPLSICNRSEDRKAGQ